MIPSGGSWKRSNKGVEVEYGFLGIMPRNLHPDDVLNGRHGVMAKATFARKLPHDAGLQVEDVITHVGDAPIYNTDGLRPTVAKLPPATNVRVTFSSVEARFLLERHFGQTWFAQQAAKRLLRFCRWIGEVCRTIRRCWQCLKLTCQWYLVW